MWLVVRALSRAKVPSDSLLVLEEFPVGLDLIVGWCMIAGRQRIDRL